MKPLNVVDVNIICNRTICFCFGSTKKTTLIYTERLSVSYTRVYLCAA